MRLRHQNVRAGTLELESQKSVDFSLRQSPTFRGLRKDPFTFWIYTVPEILRLQSEGDAQYSFLQSK